MEPIYLIPIASVDMYLLILETLISPDRITFCMCQNQLGDQLLSHKFFLQKKRISEYHFSYLQTIKIVQANYKNSPIFDSLS